MRNVHFALRLGYDGQPFCGWQLQGPHPSVAQAVLDAAAPLFEGTPRLLGASRTDSGVHARDQRALLAGDARVDAQRLMIALNARLPAQVRVYESAEVEPDWHPKQGVFGKRYVYRIWCGGAAPPSLEPLCWLRPGRHRLNLDAMNQAAELLTGEQDFESFRSTHCQAAHARRALWYLRATRNIDHPDLPPGEQAGWLIELDVRGNAFCHHQVRILAGTLVDVGRGHTAPADVARILSARDRRSAGITAPAKGLTLWQMYTVGQEEEAELPSGLSWPGAPWRVSP